jgi:hypothetical protein
MPAIPEISWRFKNESSESSLRQLLRRRASSRTMTPRAKIFEDSLSAALVP